VGNGTIKIKVAKRVRKGFRERNEFLFLFYWPILVNTLFSLWVVIEVISAFPCRAVEEKESTSSTGGANDGMNVEMAPESELAVREQIQKNQMQVKENSAHLAGLPSLPLLLSLYYFCSLPLLRHFSSPASSFHLNVSLFIVFLSSLLFLLSSAVGGGMVSQPSCLPTRSLSPRHRKPT
jgi:hypothetical protein